MLTPTQEFVLTPLARKIYGHILQHGHISAFDAFRVFGISSASLSRRICDLEEVGVGVKRVRAKDPLTGVRYTKYMLKRKED